MSSPTMWTDGRGPSWTFLQAEVTDSGELKAAEPFDVRAARWRAGAADHELGFQQHGPRPAAIAATEQQPAGGVALLEHGLAHRGQAEPLRLRHAVEARDGQP